MKLCKNFYTKSDILKHIKGKSVHMTIANHANTLSYVVYKKILIDIYNRKYTPNEKMPTLYQFCALYNVGRNTIRSALSRLEKEGIVSSEKGRNTILLLDIDNRVYQETYIDELVAHRNFYDSVYDTLSIMMPDLIIISLHKATKQQQIDILNSVRESLNENCATYRIYNLTEIFLCLVSYLNNPIVSDFLDNLMRYKFYPIERIEEVTNMRIQIDNEATSIFNYLKEFFTEPNELALKAEIQTLYKYGKELTNTYIDHFHRKNNIQTHINFEWYSNRKQEYLYSQIVLDILGKVIEGVYTTGDKIPSIEHLAKQYDVSFRTSRKAIDVLQSYAVIETINGKGSYIKVENYKQNKKAFNLILNDNIQYYHYFIEFMKFVLHSLIPIYLPILGDHDYNEMVLYAKNMKVFRFEPIRDKVFGLSNPIFKLINQEYEKATIWNMFVPMMLEVNSLGYDFAAQRADILKALEIKDIDAIIASVDLMSDVSMEITQYFMQNKD
ncbi:MAG: GntR family transcriptional regulator [Longicatena sp.]